MTVAWLYLNRRESDGIVEHALGKEESGCQFCVMSGCPHRDDEWLAVYTDFEWLFDHYHVTFESISATADKHRPHARRLQRLR